MKRLALSLLFCACFVVTNAQTKVLYFKPFPAGLAHQKISKADFKKGIQFWRKTMEASHVKLIGPNTFSSANMLADGITTFSLVKTFGEPTGEPGNDYVEMFEFMLPNSYIIARGATKMFTRADRDEKNGNPIMPDELIRPTAQDRKDKKDPVMETAIFWILNSK